jgi:hypothetical protein
MALSPKNETKPASESPKSQKSEKLSQNSEKPHE